MSKTLTALLMAAALITGASPSNALAPDEAVHFLLRTGFGATTAQIRALEPMSRAEAIRAILDSVHGQAVTPPPAFLAAPRPDWPAHHKSQDDEAKRAFNRARDAEAIQLKAWWYGEMLATPAPFTERMVLFWHNHFTSGMDKVRQPDLLFRQNALFRVHAIGNFRTLLHAVAKDPAMVRYLDSQANKKGAPNENFARELLELYTLGEGTYSEKDIREAARAFTGWHMNDVSGDFRFNKGQHDDADKTVLGKTGKLDGGDVLDTILARHEVAIFLTTKLWREFISDAPDAAEVTRLAAIYRDSGYDTRKLLDAIFASPAFWSPDNRGALVKSPVELLVGTVRTFEIPISDTTPFVEYGKRLRQDIFNPPNVKGWPGGAWWITTHTLLERREALMRLMNGSDLAAGDGMASGAMMAGAAMPGIAAWVTGNPAMTTSPASAAHQLLSVAPVAAPPEGRTGRALVEELVLDPAYQVK